jgi:hypothetical protein
MRGLPMEKSLHPQDKALLVEKAYAVTEALWTLETALWELFYDEFLDLDEQRLEELERSKGENSVEF